MLSPCVDTATGSHERWSLPSRLQLVFQTSPPRPLRTAVILCKPRTRCSDISVIDTIFNDGAGPGPVRFANLTTLCAHRSYYPHKHRIDAIGGKNIKIISYLRRIA